MSLSNVVRRTVVLFILVLSNTSLSSANQHSARKNVNEVTTTRSQPKNPLLKTPQVDHELCKKPIFPILPPGWALPRSLWSVRAMMFLQILPDGTINGTLKFHEHGKLVILFKFFISSISHDLGSFTLTRDQRAVDSIR